MIATLFGEERNDSFVHRTISVCLQPLFRTLISDVRARSTKDCVKSTGLISDVHVTAHSDDFQLHLRMALEQRMHLEESLSSSIGNDQGEIPLKTENDFRRAVSSPSLTRHPFRWKTVLFSFIRIACVRISRNRLARELACVEVKRHRVLCYS